MGIHTDKVVYGEGLFATNVEWSEKLAAEDNYLPMHVGVLWARDRIAELEAKLKRLAGALELERDWDDEHGWAYTLSWPDPNELWEARQAALGDNQ